MGLEQIIVQVNPDSLPSGSDLTAVNAARKSFGKRSDWYEVPFAVFDTYGKPTAFSTGKLKPADERLLEFLARGMTAKDFEGLLEENFYFSTFPDSKVVKELLWKWRNTPTHDTPFNHCFVSFEVKAPIFVARHLVKTEYTLMSEYSRRYITSDVEFYEHDYRMVSGDKKQGSGGDHELSSHWKRKAQIANENQLDLYNAMVEDGVAPEQARGQLPLDLMTSWTWSGTLGAMAKMCRERLGSDTQKETRYVAEQVYAVLKEHYPISAKCLVEGV